MLAFASIEDRVLNSAEIDRVGTVVATPGCSVVELVAVGAGVMHRGLAPHTGRFRRRRRPLVRCLSLSRPAGGRSTMKAVTS